MHFAQEVNRDSFDIQVNFNYIYYKMPQCFRIQHNNSELLQQ